MAAITLRFRELPSTLTETLLAESARAGEVVGAWWLTVGMLLLLAWSSHLTLKLSLHFYTLITQAILISMVISQPLALPLSRCLVDYIYRGHYHRVAEALTAALSLGSFISFISALALALIFSKEPLNIKILFASLAGALSMVWITGNVLSALEKEKIVLLGYLPAALIFLSLLSMVRFRPSLAVFIVITVIFFCGSAVYHYAYVLRGWSSGPIRPYFGFLSRRYATEAIGAFFLTLGLWADKVVFWFHPQTGRGLDLLLRYSSYDYPFFIAFTIASLAQFLVLKNYYHLRKIYKSYVDGLRYNYTFSHLYLSKIQLIGEWRGGVYRLFYLYGSVVVLILILISSGKLSLPWKNPFVFRYLLGGSVFLVFFLFNLLFLSYFNVHTLFAVLAFVFLVLNTTGTFISICKGPLYYGSGFLWASLIASLISLGCVSRILGKLEYETFKQVADTF